MGEDKLSHDFLPFSSIKEVDLETFADLMVDYVETTPYIKLRVIRFKSTSHPEINILVVPGLSSHFLGWIATDYELAKIGNVFHVESREKHTAVHLQKRVNYSMVSFAEDLYKIVVHYCLDKHGFYFLGDSFGAEIVIKYIEKNFPPPKGVILISPTKRFHFSPWMRALFSLFPYWMYRPFLPFVKFVLKHFRTDMKNDKETYYLNKRNVETGHPRRLKACALELCRYTSTVDYSLIKAPVYVIAASEDKMHVFDQTLEIVRKLPNVVKFDDVKYYHKTHTREIAKKIANFILKIEGKELTKK